MIQKIQIWHKDIYPKPQWVQIASEDEKGKVNDDDIYFYYDEDDKLDNIKQWDLIQLDEEFLVVDLEHWWIE